MSQEAASSHPHGCVFSLHTPGPGLWAPSITPVITQASSFLGSGGEGCLIALQNSFCRNRRSLSHSGDFGEGVGRGKRREGEGAKRRRKQRNGGAKTQNLLDFCLPFHLSLSQPSSIIKDWPAGGDVAVI